MSLLSEDVAAAENYRVVLPPAGGHVVIRPVMILQLQGFDGSGALYETFNFFSVNTWSSMLSRDIGNFGNHGQRTPSIILTRDVISSNDESSSDMASSTFQGIVSAGSYSKSMDSGKKLLDAVWTANLHCNIAKHGQDLFFIYVHDQSIAQLELDHKVCDLLDWQNRSHLLIHGIDLSGYYLDGASHKTKNYSRPNF
ncbi:uncharacterized protein TrAFT101_000062 [Trichoderma asperellum]|uniref:uncharacterized protein n=1 Tax=Trichoderma asperellum TaxID=101201 RepID=UPI003320E8B6|nr:hypothetical protein TrAFT101_000062 [Trichoderma asperellum]